MFDFDFFAGARPLRILDFDIENRPLSYWMKDAPTAEVTAIASCWVGDPDSMQVDLLQPEDNGPGWILERFVERYDEADVVTGHFIRGHDLPIINGALMELGMPLLKPKLTHDTRNDMKKKKDIPATQEYLLDMLDVRDEYGNRFEKFHMGQAAWREANRLGESGQEKARERVASDVYAHMAMREAMLKAGLLRGPKVWRP